MLVLPENPEDQYLQTYKLFLAALQELKWLSF